MTPPPKPPCYGKAGRITCPCHGIGRKACVQARYYWLHEAMRNGERWK